MVDAASPSTAAWPCDLASARARSTSPPGSRRSTCAKRATAGARHRSRRRTRRCRCSWCGIQRPPRTGRRAPHRHASQRTRSRSSARTTPHRASSTTLAARATACPTGRGTHREEAAARRTWRAYAPTEESRRRRRSPQGSRRRRRRRRPGVLAVCATCKVVWLGVHYHGTVGIPTLRIRQYQIIMNHSMIPLHNVAR